MENVGALKAGMINTALYLNTMYKDDQFVRIFKSNEINQRNINLTIKTAANVVGESNKSNGKSGAKRKLFNTQKHIRRFL